MGTANSGFAGSR